MADAFLVFNKGYYYNHYYYYYDYHYYYCYYIRSSLDFACPAFHYSLSKYLQTDPERVQKRALGCIFPGKSFAEALGSAGITVSVRDHQEAIAKQLLNNYYWVANPVGK